MRLLRSGMQSLMSECNGWEHCFRDHYCIGFFATRREPVHGGSGRASMRATVSKKPLQH